MDWKCGESTDFVVAEAKVAPLDRVAEILQRYKAAVFNPSRYGVFSPIDASEDFEKAVLSRNDDYLNLTLSTCVTDGEVAAQLWKWADESGQDDAFKQTVRVGILSFFGAGGILFDTKRTFFSSPDDSNAILPLREIVKREDKFIYLNAVFTNPALRGYIIKLLKKAEGFDFIDDDYRHILFGYLSQNPALNNDDSSYDGPDLELYAMKTLIYDAFQNAPTDAYWLRTLDLLASKLDPQVYSFYDIPVMDIAQKWYDATIYNRFDMDKPVEERREEEGFYTSLSGAKEFATSLVARFGRYIGNDKKLSLKDALDLQSDLLTKASYFGNKSFTLAELKEAIDCGGYFVLFWLAHNDRNLSIPEYRQAMIEGDVEDINYNYYGKRMMQIREKSSDGKSSATSSPAVSGVGEVTVAVNDIQTTVNSLVAELTKVKAKVLEIENSSKIAYGVIVVGLAMIYFKG